MGVGIIAMFLGHGWKVDAVSRSAGTRDGLPAACARALAALEAAPPGLDPTPDVGQITLACALGYRDFRFPGTWRQNHPRLVAWLDAFAKAVPAFEATTPPPG